MPKFGEASFTRLSTCHVDIQAIFFEVVKNFDCVVLEGHRGEAEQNRAFDEHKSQKKWPDGNHNKLPSLAADVAPFTATVSVDWKDIKRFYYFAGYVMGIAQRLKDEGKISHSVRWGGDWDRDTEVTDNNFNDLVHFELVP